MSDLSPIRMLTVGSNGQERRWQFANAEGSFGPDHDVLVLNFVGVDKLGLRTGRNCQLAFDADEFGELTLFLADALGEGEDDRPLDVGPPEAHR